MSRIRQLLYVAAIGTVAVTLGSCSEPTTPHRTTPTAELLAQTAQPAFLACPSDTTLSASGTIGVLGGTVSAGNTSISIPPGALLGTKMITVTIPASQYMDVDITADGTSGLTFLDAATITIDYSRCPDAAIPSDSLSAWYVSDTHAPLQFMAGVDLRSVRRLVFVTGHLSGYAIAQ